MPHYSFGPLSHDLAPATRRLFDAAPLRHGILRRVDWARHSALSERWRRVVGDYAMAINAYVARGLRDGWDAAGEEQPPPVDEALASDVHDVVCEANTTDAWRELRARFPPSDDLFVPSPSRRAYRVHSVAFIDDERVVATVGDPWELQGVFVFDLDGSVEPLPGVLAVGRSPDRRYFVRATAFGIDITEGWGGKSVARYPHPTGLEGLPPKLSIPAPPKKQLFELMLSADGMHAVVVRDDGVFVVDAAGSRRLHPSMEYIRTIELERRADEPNVAPPALRCDMIHAAVSPTEPIALVGSQCTQHELVALTGERLGHFGPIESEYAHHAAFSPDGAFAMVNSCHLYNGVTTAAPVSTLRGLATEEFEAPAAGFVTIDERCRVYASAFRQNAILLGGAYGYVHAMTFSGVQLWQHYFSGSIAAIDVSASGDRMAVGTYGGVLHLVALDAHERDPFQIGTASHRELLRFLLWKGQPTLRW